MTDAFDLHRQVLEALAKVRRSASHRVARGRSGRARLPKMARHALARGRDDLNADTSHHGERQRAAVVEVCGLDPPLALAYQFKEAFRAAMAIGKAGDVENFTMPGHLRHLVSGLQAGAVQDPGQQPAVMAGGDRQLRPHRRCFQRLAESLNHLIRNQKRQAHGYATWAGFRGQILWCFGEVVDAETGEIVARSLPRGEGARYQQPQFA